MENVFLTVMYAMVGGTALMAVTNGIVVCSYDNYNMHVIMR